MFYPRRKRPAHFPVLQPGNRSTIVFFTVCTRRKKNLLANVRAHELLVQAWQKADSWHVGRYVIMPDHVHFFASPGVYPPPPTRSWITYWKTLVAKAWPHSEDKPLWQLDYWDTQLRSGESYSSKWEYVKNNPVRAGLAPAPEDWPYQGELVSLAWHDR